MTIRSQCLATRQPYPFIDSCEKYFMCFVLFVDRALCTLKGTIHESHETHETTVKAVLDSLCESPLWRCQLQRTGHSGSLRSSDIGRRVVFSKLFTENLRANR